MNQLKLRKQLLIAESELNRAQLAGDMAALADGVLSLAGRAARVASIASTAAALAGGLAAFRRGKSADTGAKHSRLRTILKVAGLVSSLWLALRPQSRDRGGS
jgi:hypothetical protein